MRSAVDLVCFSIAYLATITTDNMIYGLAFLFCTLVSLWHFLHPDKSKSVQPSAEPTQEEINAVAEVFRSVEEDAAARSSAYIMTKKFKRVFAQQ